MGVILCPLWVRRTRQIWHTNLWQVLQYRWTSSLWSGQVRPYKRQDGVTVCSRPGPDVPKSSSRSHLRFEGGGWGRGLVLGLLGAPRVVEFEALVAEARPTFGAALGGLLLGVLTELAQDGRADVDRLAVALHHPLQG